MSAEASGQCVHCLVVMKERELMNHLDQCSRITLGRQMPDGTMHSTTIHGSKQDLAQSLRTSTGPNDFLGGVQHDSSSSRHYIRRTRCNHGLPANGGSDGACYGPLQQERQVASVPSNNRLPANGGADFRLSSSEHRTATGAGVNELSGHGSEFVKGGRGQPKGVPCPHCGTMFKTQNAEEQHSRDCMNLKIDRHRMNNGSVVSGTYQGSSHHLLRSTLGGFLEN